MRAWRASNKIAQKNIFFLNVFYDSWLTRAIDPPRSSEVEATNILKPRWIYMHCFGFQDNEIISLNIILGADI